MPHGKNYFDVRWLDEPITLFRPHGADIPATAGPWYERREAARFGLYTWDVFMQLPVDDQNAVVAHYRTHNLLEAMSAEYQSQMSKARTAKRRGNDGK